MDIAIATGRAFSGPDGPSKIQTEDVYYFCGTLCRLEWAEKENLFQKANEEIVWFKDEAGTEVIGFAEEVVFTDLPDYRVFCTFCSDLIGQ
ncbi:hypothetical protein ACFV0L_10500 [Streptosporangium canum]|uniref:hypothetical protein n=1 Tax=Streptosporangium canum TaxID=324952 RepID=UPI003679ED1B